MLDSISSEEVVFPDAVGLSGLDRRLEVLVFADALQDLPRRHLLPLTEHWHQKSGNSIQILFPGYPEEVEGAPSFSSKLFTAAVEEVQSESTWRYRGQAAAVITSARELPKTLQREWAQESLIDFDSLIEFELERALELGALDSAEAFLNALVRRAENNPETIAQKSLGDSLGIATLGTVLIDALCEDLPVRGLEKGIGLLDFFRLRRRPLR
jgi:hypothetical protein